MIVGCGIRYAVLARANWRASALTVPLSPEPKKPTPPAAPIALASQSPTGPTTPRPLAGRRRDRRFGRAGSDRRLPARRRPAMSDTSPRELTALGLNAMAVEVGTEAGPGATTK